jgi:hypothetical protein
LICKIEGKKIECIYVATGDKQAVCKGKIMKNHSVISITKCICLFVIGTILIYFPNNILGNENEKQIQTQNIKSDNQTQNKLEKTKETFNNVFNAPGNVVPIMQELLFKANDEEKNWIKETLINRFNTDPNTNIRLMCMTGMIWFREDAAKLYVQALKDVDRSVRRSAAYSLGQTGSERDIEALFQALKKAKASGENDFYFDSSVISSIGQIGGAKAAQVINEIRLNKELSKGYEDMILGVLGTTGDPNVFSILDDGLKGNDDQIRATAASGLGQLASRNRNNPELMKKIKQLLRSCINDNNWRVRYSIVKSYEIIGTREDIPLLKTMLEDSYSTTLSYTENGEVKKRTSFVVRESADVAIKNIEARFPIETPK